MIDRARVDDEAVTGIVEGRHGDPFAVLGLHGEPDSTFSVRAFLPEARSVTVLEPNSGRALADLAKAHPGGFFAGVLPGVTAPCAYRLRADWDGNLVEIEDPYRFPPLLQELDLWLLGEGTHHRPFEALGAHPTECEGVAGVRFAVWAPGAHRVSVVGDFNHWDGRRHPMRRRPGCGIWELFLPQVAVGERYQYELLSAAGELLALKADPYGFAAELRPAQASVVAPLPPIQPPISSERAAAQAFTAPISIYEVHLGSWRRVAEEDERSLSYRELADTLVPYVVDMGFTHVEFLPITEHPFDGSWGYQPIGLYAPTSRFGPPEDFRALIERFHEAGIGVLMDWVPGHFPSDAHGLGSFDGSHLFEHADPRQGFHRDWNTLIFNYGRNEVRNYLIGNALYWLERYDIDGLRVDAVASMLYLDYSREDGDWVPNAYGGRENLEAISFLRRTNEIVGTERPGAIMVAEESTAWPMVTKPPANDGLGFHYKWNLGWMNDSLVYMGNDPVNRRYHHDAMTFSLTYAFDENFVLPLSHDEVVHGKGSILQRMPGDDWQRFANLRAYYGFLFAHPGKKLLFMGNEFAQQREWNHDAQLDWSLTASPLHAGVQALVRELNRLYRDTPALHARDCEPAGFEWIDYQDRDHSVLAFLRHGHTPQALVVVVCNFTPVVRYGYRIGVPSPGAYRECLNTDATAYGGSGVHNSPGLQTEAVTAHGHDQSLALTLPPLATLMLTAI